MVKVAVVAVLAAAFSVALGRVLHRSPLSPQTVWAAFAVMLLVVLLALRLGGVES